MTNFSALTTLEIGGPIKDYQVVYTEDELIKALQGAHQNQQKFLVVGGGSNLLVSDEGYDGLVIHNRVVDIKQQDNTLIVSSGTSLQELVDYTTESGLSGMEKLIGIPGTVGGAIYGNAGAYGQTISDHLVEATCFDGQTKQILSKSDCGFSYRESNFKNNQLILLDATFKFSTTDATALKITAHEVLTKRQQKYLPGIKCPGSFFKNVLVENLSEDTLAQLPDQKDFFGKVPAWIFLDEIGAKGLQKGQVQVADFHGNLIMNLGGGTAQDFWDLAKNLSNKVYEKFRVRLEPEVQLVNLPKL